MVVAVFSYRFDVALVPALVANISPMVHGLVSCDDRRSETALSFDSERRNLLHAAARSMGADWILAVDPDERFEANLAHRIGDLTADENRRTFWKFNLREMVSATTYRTDSIWGNKEQMRLYPAVATVTPLLQSLHGNWANHDPTYRYARTGLNLYHLRHATPERSQHRRDTYAAADPERRFQYFGYDYLVDMRGARLSEIRPDRQFNPPHVEDGGLWAGSDIRSIGKPTPDPVAARLNLMSDLFRQRGADGAAYVAEDIWQQDPEDTDMQLVAASLSLRAGRPLDAVRLAMANKNADVPGFAHVIGARANAELGRSDDSAAALAHAVGDLGPNRVLSFVQQDLAPGHEDFTAADARWRRWAKGVGQILEGRHIGTGTLTVIIIGFKAPATLARAVDSIRSQSPEVEIVVVNSGGGDVRGVLHQHLDHIRLIETDLPLFVGAARNIGIACSRGTYVAFLAADCIAQPGWVADRLLRHTAGAMMVSTAVASSRPGTIIGTMVERFVFPLRSSAQSEEEVIHYGRSYNRAVFAQVGLFAPGLRVGEDTEFNRRADMLVDPVWAPEITVKHDDPKSIIKLLFDIRSRAQRAAVHLRPVNGPLSGPGSDWVTKLMQARQHQIRQFLRSMPQIGVVRTSGLRFALYLGLKFHEWGLRRADTNLSQAAISADSARACSAQNPDMAIRLAREAVDLAPQSAPFHVLLGELLLKRSGANDVSVALDHLHEALAISPTTAHALWLAASALHKLGRTAEALVLCEDAVISTPGTGAVVLVAARAANWSGKPGYALFLAQHALACDPAFIPAHQFLAQLHRMAGRLTLAEKRNALARYLQEAKSNR